MRWKAPGVPGPRLHPAFPGYDTVLSADGANLSQGQRQLLAIARAAVADPPVLILDEATSSIDTRTEALVERGMDQLMEGRTVFVIAHRLSTVRNANAIMVLEKGVIIERGSHDDLIAKKGNYQLYTGTFELSDKKDETAMAARQSFLTGNGIHGQCGWDLPLSFSPGCCSGPTYSRIQELRSSASRPVRTARHFRTTPPFDGRGCSDQHLVVQHDGVLEQVALLNMVNPSPPCLIM